MTLRFGRRLGTALSLLTAVLICAAVLLGTLMAMTRTLGVPPPQSGVLPPTGGLPEKSLALKGKLAYDGGLYKLDVNALPGYVVTLRFASSELETWAAAHLEQDVTVLGYWDKTQPSIFLVESATVS
jgi:hypothetical protein